MMLEITRSANCLLERGTPEQRALILLTLLGDDVAQADHDGLLSRPLDWHWIMMQAVKHRVLPLVWDALKSGQLLGQVMRSSGFPRLWATYATQLDWINREKNRIFLDNVERLFEMLAGAGVRAACLKGGALVGTIYHAGNRRMHDVDIVVAREHQATVTALLARLGYQQGVYDPVNATISPMSQRKLRFWSFHNHVLPHFYLPTGIDHCPYFKLSVGFDFFDPADKYRVTSEEVVADAVRKKPGSAIFVPGDYHMLINLCAHIYREGVSASYARAADNFSLIKFCDLRSFLRHREGQLDRDEIRRRVTSANLQQPFYFALHYVTMVYGDEVCARWQSLLKPDDDLFLKEIVDGKRRAVYDRPFAERLFETKSVVLAGAESGWYKEFSSDDW
jgi:hypothetical protein